MAKKKDDAMIPSDPKPSELVKADLSPDAMQLYEEAAEPISLDSLVWAKTPSGGAAAWQLDDGLGNIESVSQIEGNFVLYQPRGVLWPTEGEAVEGTTPVLISNNCRGTKKCVYGTAKQASEVLGDISPELLEEARIMDADGKPTDDFDLTRLHYCRWQTAAKGKGRRFKEQRVLAILPKGARLPIMMTVQPGSLRGVKSVVQQSQGRIDSDGYEIPYWRRWATVTLEKATNDENIAYSRIILKLSAEPVLTHEEGLAIVAEYTKPLFDELTADPMRARE